MTDPVELARELAPCGYCRGRGKSYVFTATEDECHLCRSSGAAPWALEIVRAFADAVRAEERARADQLIAHLKRISQGDCWNTAAEADYAICVYHGSIPSKGNR